MLSNKWLALAVIFVSVFCAGASFKCSPREKEITKPIRSSVEINCQLDNVLQPDEYFILEKEETEIGQCSLDGCNSTDPNSFELSLKKLNCTFQIRDLESDDSGAYYASLKNTSSVLFNRVLALNLSVNQIISQQPICGINWRKSSREIELSCEAILHSRPNLETSLQLIMMDNGTEVKVNSSLNNNLKSTQVYSVYMYNLVKLVTSLNAILTRALVPTKCVLMTSQKSNFCWYPQYIGMNFAMTADSFFGCGEKKLEVWLISNDFKLLKMHSLKPTIVDTRMANGNSFIVICGMETRGLIEIRSITEVKVKEYDTCYTARVEEHLMQTGLRIVPGCVSTPKFDPSSYRPNVVSITPNVSLPIQTTDYISSSTEIPTTAGSNSLSTVYFMSNGPTTTQMSKKLNPYLKYATLLCIVTSAILFTITTCLFLAHQKMNATDGKNLRLQYYRYNRQGDDLASVRRDDMATASTANLTSLLVNSLNSSHLDFSQVRSVSGSDGCNGEFSRATVHRPALPHRGHPGKSNHEEYHGRRINSAEVGKANAFAMVTSKCDQTENYPPVRPASEPIACSTTDVPKDTESIYHTVNDMHQDVHQDALATQLSDGATYALCPGAYADLQKEHEISALVPTGERDDRKDNHSHSEEGKLTVLHPDPDIQVKELLYAKPNKHDKRGKLTFLSSSGCLEYLVEGSSCNEPTSLESSEYAELRQFP